MKFKVPAGNPVGHIYSLFFGAFLGALGGALAFHFFVFTVFCEPPDCQFKRIWVIGYVFFSVVGLIATLLADKGFHIKETPNILRFTLLFICGLVFPLVICVLVVIAVSGWTVYNEMLQPKDTQGWRKDYTQKKDKKW